MRYLFIDRIDELVPGEKIVARKNITISEDVFTDHFPGFPIYPGALLIETMAQAGGLLISRTVSDRENRQVIPILTIVKKSKFRGLALPGDALDIIMTLENCTADAARGSAKVMCDNRCIAEAQLFYTVLDVKEHLNGEGGVNLQQAHDNLDRINKLRKLTLTGAE